ncbi:MAG: DUF3990 domain-containing protein [Bacteroidales bacterium]|jgi:hypothetical protein|nr:DUF3990 domain-containing protein [Bacteroidales bacterium]
MILYHGSNIKVSVPDLSHSKPFKDFGKGFYLSDNYQQAWEMAEQKVKQIRKGEPIVSEFQFDESLIHSDELSIKIFSDYSEEWANFVLDNRDKNLPQPIHNYDIVYGPIADDGVTFQLRRYQGGVISLARLVEELIYAKGITFQYYFGTERALQKLTAL